MKIAVIGGGPGGLLFAVLMKRADRRHQILVLERNAPDATFGFGVVFPERSSRYLQEADPEVHEAFTSASVHWDAIEYRHQGRVLRCGGHSFFGIARMDLLALLQQQARQLGVDLRFNHEVDTLSALAGFDLIVAADGVNSLARSALAGQFKPAIHVGRSKYIWLGTTQTFDALTFIFEEGAHGWFGAHIYPYSRAASTFIVETDDDTWRRAGLDQAAEAARDPRQSDLDTLAYCELLFARHLDGHKLLANNSKWLNFRTVRNRTWHAGNVMLLGDAAHTAHFSVGSGTRMALEDAIALAGAVQRDADLDAAVAAYEAERRPAVGYIQRAAEPSRRWWERFRHWTHFTPEQFAFHHLSRTRVLTYGTLTVRDPGFVRAAANWFARSTGAPPAFTASESGPAIQPALTPLQLRDVRLSNRIVADATEPHTIASAGLVITNASATEPSIVATESLRARGATRIGLGLVPTQRSVETDTRLIDECVHATRSGSAAGFDLLELDGRGGTPAGAALIFNLLEAVRAAWPEGRPICVQLAAWENPEDDQAVDAGLEFARALKAHGCDVIAVCVPRGLAERDPERARAAHVFTSDLIRNLAGLPTMLTGGAYSAGDVNALILSGQADLCGWPRLAWPGWRPAPHRC